MDNTRNRSGINGPRYMDRKEQVLIDQWPIQADSFNREKDIAYYTTDELPGWQGGELGKSCRYTNVQKRQKGLHMYILAMPFKYEWGVTYSKQFHNSNKEY